MALVYAIHVTIDGVFEMITIFWGLNKITWMTWLKKTVNLVYGGILMS